MWPPASDPGIENAFDKGISTALQPSGEIKRPLSPSQNTRMRKRLSSATQEGESEAGEDAAG